MSDVNSNNNIDVQSLDVELNNSSNVVGNGENPEKTNQPKMLSQDEVNSIVQSRLKKQKEGFDLERESLGSELDVYRRFVESYVEETMLRYNTTVGDILKKLSVADQLDWIQKNKDEINIQNQTTIPETPSGGDKKTFKPSNSKFRL